MPFNLLKIYPELLDIGSLNETERTKSLRSIFKRDIEEHPDLCFRNKKIWPIKDDKDSMELLFKHLTTEEREIQDENNRKYKKRFFEMDRSRRLHWVKYHIEETKSDNMEYFSVEERIKEKNVIRTYIYDLSEKYVIVLEPQRTGNDYYLLTAYYLNKPEGLKTLQKKLKRKLNNVI